MDQTTEINHLADVPTTASETDRPLNSILWKLDQCREMLAYALMPAIHLHAEIILNRTLFKGVFRCRRA